MVGFPQQQSDRNIVKLFIYNPLQIIYKDWLYILEDGFRYGFFPRVRFILEADIKRWLPCLKLAFPIRSFVTRYIVNCPRFSAPTKFELPTVTEFTLSLAMFMISMNELSVKFLSATSTKKTQPLTATTNERTHS